MAEEQAEQKEEMEVKQAIEGPKKEKERVEFEEQHIFKQVRSISFSVLSSKMINLIWFYFTQKTM